MSQQRSKLVWWHFIDWCHKWSKSVRVSDGCVREEVIQYQDGSRGRSSCTGYEKLAGDNGQTFLLNRVETAGKWNEWLADFTLVIQVKLKIWNRICSYSYGHVSTVELWLMDGLTYEHFKLQVHDWDKIVWTFVNILGTFWNILQNHHKCKHPIYLRTSKWHFYAPHKRSRWSPGVIVCNRDFYLKQPTTVSVRFQHSRVKSLAQGSNILITSPVQLLHLVW